MSPRRPTPPPPKPPDFPPEKTYTALKRQLAALDKFRGKKYFEVEHEEQELNLTLNVLNHGFGENSEYVSQFHHAKWAGEHYMGGMSPGLIQQNFQKRIEGFAAMLKSSLAELELMMPEPELAGAYEPGNEYRPLRCSSGADESGFRSASLGGREVRKEI